MERRRDLTFAGDRHGLPGKPPGRAMRVFGWLADQAGCGYYRVAGPLWALEQRGHSVAWLEQMPDEVATGGWDVIVGQRICLPGPSKIWQRLAAEGRSTLVYEIDDDLLDVDPANKQAHAYYTEQKQPIAVHTSLREVRYTVTADTGRRQRIIDNITVADLVTVSTEPLAAVVRAFNPNVVVLPNCVPARYLEHQRPRTDRVTVGWRGGGSHTRDFGEAAKPIRSFLQRHPDTVEFHSIGADYTDRVRSRRSRVRHTPWLSTTEEFIRTVDFDIGVVPLRPSKFNDSKSDLALLEMAALGIPVVASDTGPYRRAVDAGAPALLASNARDWTGHLTALLDPALRAMLGGSAHEWARTRTIEGNAARWEQAYERAMAGKATRAVTAT